MFTEIDPQTGVQFQVTRDKFYKQTFHPSKRYKSSASHWPKEGESMTKFMKLKSQSKARDYIEQNKQKYSSLLATTIHRRHHTVQSATFT